MKIKIDRRTVDRATLITGTPEYGDVRRYYEIGPAIIVCRNGLDLVSLANRVVDARVGWDTAQPGFTTDEARIGTERTKVTIYRMLRGQWYEKTLGELLAATESD